jgi:hypothetical protein
MPHKFRNHEKISALNTWIGEMQDRVDRVKDAINTADTMDRWTGVPDSIRDLSLQNALEYAQEFSRYAHEGTDPSNRIKVSADHYNRAITIAREIAEPSEVQELDGRQTFKVPLWATERIVKQIKLGSIRCWVNTV